MKPRSLICWRDEGLIVASTGCGWHMTTGALPPLAKAPREPKQPSCDKTFRLKLNILVIDDMAPIVMLAERILTKHEHTVFSATSGQEALEIFSNAKIDVVICDLGMPGMNGWEVGKAIQTICQERGMPKPPFILLTGWGGQAFEEENVIDAGVDADLEKPIDNEKLMATIRELVEQDPS